MYQHNALCEICHYDSKCEPLYLALIHPPHEALMAWVIDLQILLENFRMSIKAQGKIFNKLLGFLTYQPYKIEVETLDCKNLSLRKLLSLVGPNYWGS
jgi:hypothetical protein